MYFVFSSELTTDTLEESTKKQFQAANALSDYCRVNAGRKAKMARGVYKGEGENCFILKGGMGDWGFVRYLAFGLFNQESILAINPSDSQAELHYSDGRSVIIGTCQRVSREVALQQEASTYVDGQYFVCSKDNLTE